MNKSQAAADILAQLLPLVPFEGWNQQVLGKAALATGYKKTDAIRVFPGGAIDAAEFFIRSDRCRYMLEAPATGAIIRWRTMKNPPAHRHRHTPAP